MKGSMLYALLALVLAASPSFAVLIEGFEEGNLNAYTVLGNVNDAVTTAAAHDGTYGLEIRGVGGNEGWILRDDAQVHNQQGDVISYWVHTNAAATGRCYNGFGASLSGCYSMVIAPNTAQFVIQANAGFGYTDLAAVGQSWQASKWYRLELDWATGGHMTASLYDSDGTTLLNTVSAVDNTFTGGGLAFRGFDAGIPWYVDTITLNEGPVATQATSWGHVKALYH